MNLSNEKELALSFEVIFLLNIGNVIRKSLLKSVFV